MQTMPPNQETLDDCRRRLRLEGYCAQIEALILARQNPITGLLPAANAVTVHGDYTHAWVRDNVYSILAAWGLWLAYRRLGDDESKPYRLERLEQSVVKLMRGLLKAMMNQVQLDDKDQQRKVELFKYTQEDEHALHAKYDTHTGEPVVGDKEWGHLQLDATSLFLLMLAQMTTSGLRIVHTLDEVDFVQNLAYYIGPAYRIPDYGIWERGDRINKGIVEINASSVGMAKAALEALRDLDLFGIHGEDPASVIRILPDDIARARMTLKALLPHESASKEIDGALLSIIGFPAYAVEDKGLVERTRQEIIDKLQGHYGCKRFLRDGHQTALEDPTDHLYYEFEELTRFEKIESEWPLFFTYFVLDGLLRDDAEQVREYRDRLEDLFVMRDGQRLLPELYKVPEDCVERERENPGSQKREPGPNVPLVWAQSLYLLGGLLREGFIQPSDIDPLDRRRRLGHSHDTLIIIALLAEDAKVQADLENEGIHAPTLEQIQPVQLCPASELRRAFGEVGRNAFLNLTGRPPRPLASLSTGRVFIRHDEALVFLPPFLDPNSSYLWLDNRLLAERLKDELTYFHDHWDQPDHPLLAVLISDSMRQADGYPALRDFLKELQDKRRCNEIRVAMFTEWKRLADRKEIVPTPQREYIDYLRDFSFKTVAAQAIPLTWEKAASHPLPAAKIATWQRASNPELEKRIQESHNPYEQIELIGLLADRLNLDHTTRQGYSLREWAEAIYAKASERRLWGVVRRATGLLGTYDKKYYDDELEDAVAQVVIHQKQVAVGPFGRHIIGPPLENAEIISFNKDRIIQTIQDYLKEHKEYLRKQGGDAPYAEGQRRYLLIQVLIQEILVFLGRLIEAHAERFQGTHTLSTGDLLQFLNSQLGAPKDNAFENFNALLEQSPYAIYNQLHRVIKEHLANIDSAGVGSLTWKTFLPTYDPTPAPSDGRWHEWRKSKGVITYLPEDFYERVWAVLRQCPCLITRDDSASAENRLERDAWRVENPLRNCAKITWSFS